MGKLNRQDLLLVVSGVLCELEKRDERGTDLDVRGRFVGNSKLKGNLGKYCYLRGVRVGSIRNAVSGRDDVAVLHTSGQGGAC